MANNEFSEKWRDRFKFFNQHGLPGMDSYRAALGQLSFSRRTRIHCNGYAFIFGFLYFCILGLWKKGLVLFITAIVVNLLISLIEGLMNVNLNVLDKLMNFVYMYICSTSANTAYYLRVVKGIDSWNPLQGLTRKSINTLSRR